MKKIAFINCKIDASKKVFLPRTETEFWVKKVLKKIKNRNPRPNIQVLDIFAGTGCIGIAVLQALPGAVRRVDFADIWPDAIKQIKINLKLNEIAKERYGVYRSNMFKKLKGRKYDFIFANPPYVALDRVGEVQKEVLEKEPHVALFAGKDGTVLIKKFFSQVKKYLKPGGKIFIEFDPLQKREINEISKKEGFVELFKKDQFGKIRWVEVQVST